TADGRHPHTCKRLVTFEATTIFFYLLCNPPSWFIDPSISGLSCTTFEAADALLHTNSARTEKNLFTHMHPAFGRLRLIYADVGFN
ncbi:uncharacterized protein PgNI_02976, partial [Pyricularia grisea]|uniref:Uncharacterized protein n=1 Tax=Pyricularia grisea TaxID=148305 RepID=A0A6P8BDQ6_PYRGI